MNAELYEALQPYAGTQVGERVAQVVARLIEQREAAARAEAKADGVREAADNLYLSEPGQVHEHTKTWLHRRANLIDPRTRDSVCEHGNPLSSSCGYCTSDRAVLAERAGEGAGA